jgi:hypothetical protein
MAWGLPDARVCLLLPFFFSVCARWRKALSNSAYRYRTMPEITSYKWETCRGLGFSFAYNRLEGEDHVRISVSLSLSRRGTCAKSVKF